jgi:hypothetical protein
VERAPKDVVEKELEKKRNFALNLEKMRKNLVALG